MCFFLGHLSELGSNIPKDALSCYHAGTPIHDPSSVSWLRARRFSLKISLYLAPSIFNSAWCSHPVPLTGKQPQSIMFPPPCLMVGMVFFGFKSALFSLQTWWVELMPKNSILVSSDHSNFSQTSSELSRCYLQTSDGPVYVPSWVGGPYGHYMISVHYDSVLLMIILVTMVPAALRSSTSSCCVVLGCSLTFLIIRFPPCWEILHGAPDQGRLIVNQCFFHFLIITQTVDSLPRGLSIIL